MVLGICYAARGKKRNGVEASAEKSCGRGPVMINHELKKNYAIQQFIMNE